MARVPPRVPAADDLLCEKCGYVLNGLAAESRCPECGTLIADSLGSQRLLTSWELPEVPRPYGFFTTTSAVIFHPTRFYRTLLVRGPLEPARRFACIHWWLAAAAFGVAATVHGACVLTSFSAHFPLSTTGGWTGLLRAYGRGVAELAGISLVLTVATYFILQGVTRLAARLSTWEATYRGLRLPYTVVLRGLYFHAAHYLPVASAAVATVVGYQLLLYLGWVSFDSTSHYLYLLCAEVIGSAAFLFHTYWIGMRNMMYANR